VIWHSSPFAFCFNKIAMLKMETTPEFLLLLPVALFLAHAEFTTAKSKIVEDDVHQKMCKQRLLTPQSNSFLLSLLILANLNSIPQSTILCNETWAVTFHIDLCELSPLGTDLFSFSLLHSLFLLFPWSLSPCFCIALFFFPAAHCDKNRDILFFSVCEKAFSIQMFSSCINIFTWSKIKKK